MLPLTMETKEWYDMHVFMMIHRCNRNPCDQARRIAWWGGGGTLFRCSNYPWGQGYAWLIVIQVISD